MNLSHVHSSIPGEPPINPPEPEAELQPLKYDDVPIEDVHEFRWQAEAIQEKLNTKCKIYVEKIYEMTTKLIADMTDSLHTAHGINDPQPEKGDL